MRGVIAGLLVDGLTAPMFVLAGLAAVAAGLGFKFLLITRAGYNQGFALLHTPVRGTGRAGPAVKPGWTLSRHSKGADRADRNEATGRLRHEQSDRTA